MTKIVEGYAQPDIVAEKDNKKIAIFVETPYTLHSKGHMRSIAKSCQWLKKHEPNTEVQLIHTVPKERR